MPKGRSATGRAKTRGARASAAPPARTLRYIESSALVAALLEHDTTARASIGMPGLRVTSTLTIAEAMRAIIRARSTGRLSATAERSAVRVLQAFVTRCDLATITDDVLARVGRRFPVEPIRTLDAVHLATVESFGEPAALVTVITRDARVRDNAAALGYMVE